MYVRGRTGWEHIRSLRHLIPKWHTQTKISPSLTKHKKTKAVPTNIVWNVRCTRHKCHTTCCHKRQLTELRTNKQDNMENLTYKHSLWTSRFQKCFQVVSPWLFSNEFQTHLHQTNVGAVTRANKTEGRMHMLSYTIVQLRVEAYYR